MIEVYEGPFTAVCSCARVDVLFYRIGEVYWWDCRHELPRSLRAVSFDVSGFWCAVTRSVKIRWISFPLCAVCGRL